MRANKKKVNRIFKISVLGTVKQRKNNKITGTIKQRFLKVTRSMHPRHIQLNSSSFNINITIQMNLENRYTIRDSTNL